MAIAIRCQEAEGGGVMSQWLGMRCQDIQRGGVM